MKIITAITLIALTPFVAFANTQNTAPESTEKTAPAPKKTSTPDGWTDDFEAAKKQAAAEGKDLIVAFSGSDWCGWCVRLEKEVFSKDGFTEKVSELFVPVYIDNPNDISRLSPLAQKQNEALTKQYHVKGFPSVLLMDAQGHVFAKTGYAFGGPEKYLEMLKKLQKDSKNSPEYHAQKALLAVPKGPDRIKKLDEILAPSSIQFQLANEAYVNEILAADADGSLGYRAKYPYFTVALPLNSDWQSMLTNLTTLADAEIKAQGSPADKAVRLEIIKSVLRKNVDTLSAFLARVKEAQKIFPENTTAAQELLSIQSQIEHLRANYIDEKKQ